MPSYNCRADFFKYSFFPFTLNDWFNLNDNIRNSKLISIFKSKLLFFIFSVQSNIDNIFDPKGLKLLIRLSLGLRHLMNINEHRLRHNFEDCTNPLCSCSLEIGDTSHYLLPWHYFNHQQIDLMSSVKSVCHKFESMPDNNKKMFFYKVTLILIKTKINLF